MRRTTSLLEISPSLWATTQSPSRPTWLDETFLEAIPMVPERKNVKRRHSNDLSLVNASHFFDAAHFLNVCGLCKRSIGPGTDTFMYREVAFCSKECRDKRITEDWRKKKRSLSSMKKANLPPPIMCSESSA